MAAELLEVGRIGRAHGVHGDVAVELVTDRIERLQPGSRLSTPQGWLVVDSARRHGSRWLVHFHGVDDRTAAEAMSGMALSAEPLPASEGELWVHQLIGCRVVDLAGVDHGRCVAVIDNPAHDLLELDSGCLVPVVFVEQCRGGVVTIDPPDGLFDLGG